MCGLPNRLQCRLIDDDGRGDALTYGDGLWIEPFERRGGAIGGKERRRQVAEALDCDKYQEEQMRNRKARKEPLSKVLGTPWTATQHWIAVSFLGATSLRSG